MARMQLFRRGAERLDDPDDPRAQSPSDLAVEAVVEVDRGTDETPLRDDEERVPPASRDDLESPRGVRGRLLASTPVNLALAAHPRQSVLTALALAAAALVSGRPGREAAVVLVTVLVGQSILGWHNDLVDAGRDAAHDTPRKPVAQGRLDPGTTWYALVVAVLLVIPLSLSVGVTAGIFYLASLLVGILGNVVLRRGRLSPLPWMASYALYPAYLSYGGYGGSAEGSAPEVAMVVAAAFLGLGVHFLRAIWGLVEDDKDGWTYLPLALGRRLGATRLLVVSTAYTGVVLAVVVLLGSTVGLRQ